MSSNPKKNALLDEILEEVEQAQPLDHWTSFIETLHFPREMAPAMVTGRPELLAILQPRDLTAAECKVMFDLIGGLIRTNIALRQHAEKVSQLTDNWAGAFKQLASVGYDIQAFAKFERVEGAREQREADEG